MKKPTINLPTMRTGGAVRTSLSIMLVIAMWILFIGFWAFVISFAIWGAMHGAK